MDDEGIRPQPKSTADNVGDVGTGQVDVAIHAPPPPESAQTSRGRLPNGGWVRDRVLRVSLSTAAILAFGWVLAVAAVALLGSIFLSRTEPISNKIEKVIASCADLGNRLSALDARLGRTADQVDLLLSVSARPLAGSGNGVGKIQPKPPPQRAQSSLAESLSWTSGGEPTVVLGGECTGEKVSILQLLARSQAGDSGNRAQHSEVRILNGKYEISGIGRTYGLITLAQKQKSKSIHLLVSIRRNDRPANHPAGIFFQGKDKVLCIYSLESIGNDAILVLHIKKNGSWSKQVLGKRGFSPWKKSMSLHWYVGDNGIFVSAGKDSGYLSMPTIEGTVGFYVDRKGVGMTVESGSLTWCEK